MQIINLPRGGGKTTRAVVLSELYKYPILVASRPQKEAIYKIAEELQADIPDPIFIKDLQNCQSGIIVDEGLLILSALITDKAGFPINVQSVTLSVSQNNLDRDFNKILISLDDIQKDLQNLLYCGTHTLYSESRKIGRKVQNIREKIASLKAAQNET